jgi:hypothetical protein
LESQQSRVSRVLSNEEKHPSRRAEINKASNRWQWTTKNLTAFRAIWTRLDNFPKAPGKLIPISSIALTLKSCQWLYETWVCNERRCIHE